VQQSLEGICTALNIEDGGLISLAVEVAVAVPDLTSGCSHWLGLTGLKLSKQGLRCFGVPIKLVVRLPPSFWSACSYFLRYHRVEDVWWVDVGQATKPTVLPGGTVQGRLTC
jgi:hypothetical protein